MRIALIGPANPYRGGIAKSNDAIAENMHILGHEVLVANFSMQYPSVLFPGQSQYTTLQQVPYASRRLLNSISPISWKRTADAIAEFNPEIAIFRYWMPFMAPSLGTVAGMLKRRGIRTVAITDNVIPHEKRPLDRNLTRYFLKGIDKVVCMSRTVLEELSEIGYTGETGYHPHPVYNTYGEKVNRDYACKRLELDPTYSYTMFFGFIRDYKGLDLLLEAWAKIKREGRKLLVAGEFYSGRDKYMSMVDDLGLAGDVIFRSEYIPEDDVNLYFSVADLLVQPYRTASQSGISGIAYNYCLPMIVTNVGGLKETITDGKEGLITSTSIEEIAAAIEKYYASGLKDEFSANMESRLSEFTWQGLIKILIDR